MGRIFRKGGAKYFDISYLPRKTPHREREIELIYNLLSKGIEEEVFKIPVIYGSSGTGKTMTIRKVFKMLKANYNGEIETYILNSITANKSYIAIRRIASNLIPLPERGYSINEMLERLYNVLEMRNIRYLIALDDSDELIRKERGEIIELFTRIEEEVGKRYIYLVIVLRNLIPIIGLQDYIKSKIGGLTIEFKPYNRKELIDIINERINLGFNPDSISENAIELSALISEKIYDGNAREMINLVYRGGIIAEADNDERVLSDHIRKAFYSSYSRSIAPHIDKEEAILIYAIAKVLNNYLDQYIIDENLMKQIYNTYLEIIGTKSSYDEFCRRIDEKLYEAKRILYKDEKNRYIFFYYPVKTILERFSRYF